MLDPDLDVWVSGTRVAVSGPTQEWLFSGTGLSDVVTRLGAGALSEAALTDGDGAARRLRAMRRLRGMHLVGPHRHPPASAPCGPATLPLSGLAVREAADCLAVPAPCSDATLVIALRGDPATAVAALAAHLDAGQAWLPLRLTGPKPWAGPLFGPAPGACPRCLALRLHGATEVARAARADPSARHLRHGNPIARPDRVAVLLAALDRLLATDRHGLHGAMLSAGPGGLARHPVARGVCGCAADPALAGLPLAVRVARLCDPLAGPVQSLADIAAPGDAMRVFSGSQSPVACWAGLAPPDLATLAGIARGNHSGGCAPDAASARLRAAMEGIECYASLWRGGTDGVAAVAAFADLPSGTAISPQALLNLSAAQQADPALAADLPRAWCPASELDAAGQAMGRVLLPLAMTYDGVPGATLWETNGLGAGASGVEAQVHALAELVERDAVAIWWHNALPRPRLKLPEGDATAGAAIADHHRRGRSLVLLDLTHDLGVPVRAALSWDTATGGAILAGFAADADARRADRRALAESCLRLPALDQWRRHGAARSGRLPAWFAGATMADFTWLLSGPPGRAPSAAPMDAGQRLGVLLGAILGAGLRPLVVDLMRPDVGIPVVKAFVPGLRHTRNRFGPGRLFDVPVRLGWLASPRREADLLPFPEGLW